MLGGLLEYVVGEIVGGALELGFDAVKSRVRRDAGSKIKKCAHHPQSERSLGSGWLFLPGVALAAVGYAVGVAVASWIAGVVAASVVILVTTVLYVRYREDAHWPRG